MMTFDVTAVRTYYEFKTNNTVTASFVIEALNHAQACLMASRVLGPDSGGIRITMSVERRNSFDSTIQESI